MKKYMAGMAAVLLVLGVVMMGSGWAMGARTSLSVDFFGHPIDVGMHGFHSGIAVTEMAYEDTHGYLSDMELEPYQDLDIDISMGDVEFQTADSFGLEMEWYGHNYDLHCSNENGKLKIWSTSVPNIGINMNMDYGGTVTVYLPQDAELRDVEIETALGSADIRGFQAKDLTIVADLGDVELCDIKAEQADLTLNLGSLTTTGFTTEKSLVVDADLGDVDLDGAFYGTVDIDADLGGVFVNTALSRNECSYELETSLGSIYLDGKDMDDYAEKGGGSDSIKIHADLGDIRLNFQ